MKQTTTHDQKNLWVLCLIISVALIILTACTSSEGKTRERVEESGPMLALDQTYDQIRGGARLVLSYDTQSNTFNGFVENTTDEMLKLVRVEVHLSDGSELGPTKPTNLKPGEIKSIHLPVGDISFDAWTAHPEVGKDKGVEHGDDDEGGEHGKSGEHGNKGGGSD